MTGNFVMLQKEDLKTVVSEIVEEILGCRKPEELVEPEKEYYTREQTCRYLHISPTKLWRMEKEGLLIGFKIGRRNLYSKSAVDALIKSNVVENN